jgi:hypothetical protein
MESSRGLFRITAGSGLESLDFTKAVDKPSVLLENYLRDSSMIDRLSRVTTAEAIRVLERLGFFLARQSGEHKIYKGREESNDSASQSAGEHSMGCKPAGRAIQRVNLRGGRAWVSTSDRCMS